MPCYSFQATIHSLLVSVVLLKMEKAFVLKGMYCQHYCMKNVCTIHPSIMFFYMIIHMFACRNTHTCFYGGGNRVGV